MKTKYIAVLFLAVAGCVTHTFQPPVITGFGLSGRVVERPRPADAPQDSNLPWYQVDLKLFEHHADGTSPCISGPRIIMRQDATAKLDFGGGYGEVNLGTGKWRILSHSDAVR